MPFWKLQIYTHSVCQWVTIVCTPLPLSVVEEGIEPPSKFSEKWHVTQNLNFWRGVAGKDGGLGVVRGVCSFYLKSKN